MEFTPALRPHEAEEEEEFDPADCGIKKRLFLDVETDELDFEAAPTPSRKETVLMYLRVRPKRPAEIMNHDPDCLHQINEHELVAIPPKTSKTCKNSRAAETSHKFSFSRIFNPATTQKELFDETLRPLLKDFFDGQNCLVFTYGVTNSGR